MMSKSECRQYIADCGYLKNVGTYAAYFAALCVRYAFLGSESVPTDAIYYLARGYQSAFTIFTTLRS